MTKHLHKIRGTAYLQTVWCPEVSYSLRVNWCNRHRHTKELWKPMGLSDQGHLERIICLSEPRRCLPIKGCKSSYIRNKHYSLHVWFQTLYRCPYKNRKTARRKKKKKQILYTYWKRSRKKTTSWITNRCFSLKKSRKKWVGLVCFKCVWNMCIAPHIKISFSFNLHIKFVS